MRPVNQGKEANLALKLNTSMEPQTEDFKNSLAELIATLLFVFVGVGSIAAMLQTAPDLGGGIVIIAAAHGLAIALLAAGIGGISGGHINPAVTFSMFITGQIALGRAIMYVVAQLIGAVIGMLLLKIFLVGAVFDAIPGAGGHAVNDAVVVSKRGTAPAPLFIGFAVFVFHLVAIPMTGAGANPARTFGPALISGEWADHWVYWIGPLLGAAIASLGYWYLYLQDEGD